MSKHILVTGDPICDHNYYKGERPTADSGEPRGFRYAHEGGGALLLKNLIARVMDDETDSKVEFGLDEDFISLPLAYHAFCFWEPQLGKPDDDAKDLVEFWRAVEPPLGYGHTATPLPEGQERKLRSDAYSPGATPCAKTPEIVVIDDAGIGFRSAFQKTLDAGGQDGGAKDCPRWVVLKLTGSIEPSPLWDRITKHCTDNLVVIVPAEELRRREVRLSRGLSWEATAEDLTAELHRNPRLAPLLKARHLIVTFQSDAAFWLDNKPGEPCSLLVFDAPRAEGEWSASQGTGGAFGFLSCFTAAIVRELARSDAGKQPDLETALGAGLGASRELRRFGHGQVVVDKTEPEPGFPFSRIVGKIREYDALIPTESFVSALIPQGGRARGDWMMLDEWQVLAQRKRPHYEAALAVAVLGPESLGRFPVAVFGTYQTVDRKEIESLRTIRQLINNYLKEERPNAPKLTGALGGRGTPKAPLNLGVFGPPGSGKSYIVYQIAKAVGIGKEDVLLFNLSQFKDAGDICGAFHQIRDKVLKRVTPLVFWDEFDSQGYRWLQYLLAPMEDGEFQDGQITHPLGKCVFVFAGATSATFDRFGPINPGQLSKDHWELLEKSKPDHLRDIEKTWREFVLAKGPDFKSRLVAYLNLLGMNRRQECKEENGRRRWVDDPSDLYFPIRRALFIRNLFELKKGERLCLDRSVLRALLEIPAYKGAGRSLQFLCTHLRKEGSGRPTRSSLPGHELLNMHVDAEGFWALCEQDMEFVPKARELAKQLHEAYRLRIKDRPAKRNLDVPLDQLSDDMQSANIAQARRIPAILRLAGMHLESGPIVPLKDLPIARHATEEPMRQWLADKNNLELLAEAEHIGWMVERMLNGWKYGRKPDDVKMRHDCLIPYSQLSGDVKDYDRQTIVGKPAPEGKPDEEQFGYVDIVKTVGLRVVKGEGTPAPSQRM